MHMNLLEYESVLIANKKQLRLFKQMLKAAKKMNREDTVRLFEDQVNFFSTRIEYWEDLRRKHILNMYQVTK